MEERLQKYLANSGVASRRKFEELILQGKVVVNGKLANMVGTICMDSFMIDVTDIPEAKVGTEVFIWDNNVRKLEDIANECNTINYEIISTISDRVPRKFI